MKLFAVIPTVGERDATLVPMLNQLFTDGVTPIIVSNGPRPVFTDLENLPALLPQNYPYFRHHYWNGEPVNLSKIWNMGLDWAEALSHGEEFVVAIFNDDLTLPPGTVQAMAWAIEHNDAAAAFITHGRQPFRTLAGDPLHLGNRMCGFAFALLGSKKLRADEELLWWWGDTDLDLRARAAGGVVAVPMSGLQHHDPNGYTNRNPELTAQAGRDRETFRRKWGYLPW